MRLLSSQGTKDPNRNPVFDDIAPDSKLKPVAVVTYCISGSSIKISSICFAITSDLCNEAASGNCIFTKKYPISSSGIKPPGTNFPNITAPRVIITINITLLLSFLVTILVKLIYESVVLSIHLLNTPKNLPRIPVYLTGFFNNIEAKAGLSVKAFTEDTITDTTIVIANC